MNDIQREFLEIVADVRTHVEFQKALGVTAIALSSEEAGAPPVSAHSNEPPSAQETSPGAEVPQSPALDAVRAELGDCTRCKLHQGRKTLVFGEGNPDAALVFIGEGPGFEEDQQGRPFVGAAGELLTKIIEKGMKLRRQDVYICNIVKCRPAGNRNPEPDEIETCVPFLRKQLQAIKPKVIIALGNVAAKALLKTTEGISKIRGTWQTYDNIPLMPTYHPAYLLRNPRDKALVWEDIKKVMAELEKIQKGRTSVDSIQ